MEDKKDKTVTIPEEEFRAMSESIAELKKANKDLSDSLNRLWAKTGELSIMGTAQPAEKKTIKSLSDLFKKGEHK